MRNTQTTPRIQYIRDLFAPEDDYLKSMRESLGTQDFSIQIGAEEGKFLQLLIKMRQIETILEIGTHAAYSTIWMARALGGNGHITTLENSPHRIARARKNIANSDMAEKITLVEGEALDSLARLNQMWDMIFIDADKINYAKYLDWAEAHIRKGGLIIGDNTYLFENVYKDQPDGNVRYASYEAMRDFNKRLANPDKYCSIMLPTAEGITIAMKL